MPSQYETVPAIVPAAAADHDRPGDAQPAKNIRAAASRVLHQHQAHHPELLDRQPVDTLRLLPRDRYSWGLDSHTQ